MSFFGLKAFRLWVYGLACCRAYLRIGVQSCGTRLRATSPSANNSAESLKPKELALNPDSRKPALNCQSRARRAGIHIILSKAYSPTKASPVASLGPLNESFNPKSVTETTS